MKGWQAILIALAVTAVLLVFVTVTLPKHFRIERSVTVDAPPEAVWAQIGDVRAHAAWSPWVTGREGTTVAFSPETTGEGAYYEWTSPDGESGRFTITASDRRRRIEYTVATPDLGTPGGWIEMAPEHAGTLVTWRFEGVAEGPMGGVVAVLVDRLAAPQVEEALASIEALAEAAPIVTSPTLDLSAVPGEGTEPGGALPPLP